jgi:hypothetical protein
MGGITKQTERILRQPVEKNATQALKQQVRAWTKYAAVASKMFLASEM